MKLNTFFNLLFLLILQTGFSQVAYFDRDLNEISKDVFLTKLKTDQYQSISLQSDTIQSYKLRRKEIFGKLDSLTNSQLRMSLFRFYKVDTAKTLFIHYMDTLTVVANMPLHDTLIVKVKTDKQGAIKTSHQHRISFETEKKNLLKEVRLFEKFQDARFLHLVNVFNDYPVMVAHHKMMKDQNLLYRKVFSDGIKPYVNIILYKDGTFLMTTYQMTVFQIRKRLKQNKFDKEKSKWKP